MSSRIEIMLEAARDRVRSWLPELATCEVHDGRVDAAEIDRVAIRAPAVLLALLEVPRVEPERAGQPAGEDGYGGRPGTATARLRIGAFVIAEDAREPGPGVPTSAWKAARAMCERIATGVALDSWQVGFRRERPEGVLVTSRFDTRRAGSGIALMAVAWEQRIELSEPGTAGDARPLPAELYRGIDPETGGSHVADYEKLAPAEDA